MYDFHFELFPVSRFGKVPFSMNGHADMILYLLLIPQLLITWIRAVRILAVFCHECTTWRADSSNTLLFVWTIRT